MLNDASQFYGKRVIVTKKMDGESTTIYKDGYVHARSLDSQSGIDRDWVKTFAQKWCFNLPEGWRVCGENLWAEHSIHYDDLPSYFLGFSIWNERNVCLSWDDTMEWFEMLGITPVPVMYDGEFDPALIRRVEPHMDWEKDEGYVIRVADSFKYGEFKSSIAKFVRANHVQTVRHWRQGARFNPNGLKK